MPLPSEMDDTFERLAREHIDNARVNILDIACTGKILEIGPTADGVHPWDTLDIRPGRTFQADITRRTPIKDSAYSLVIAQEVLEHTTDPFSALREIRRILKPNGTLIASAPFNFREHNPLPDLWRFTRHGWRWMLRNWDDVALDVLMTPGRPLMPLHINAVARCNKTKMVDSIPFLLETT